MKKFAVALLLFFVLALPAVSRNATALNISVRLVLNETAAKIYVPGQGESAFADLTNAYYSSPEHYYIASYKDASLYGLVFQGKEARGIFTNKTEDTFSLGIDMAYPDSVVFLIFSQGDWKTVNNRIDLVEKGTFADYSEPTFAFGLGAKQKMKILMQYENVDILGGRRDVGRGTTPLAIKHEGLYGEDVGLNITRPP